MASCSGNGSRGHHKFTLNVWESYVSGATDNYSTVGWSLDLSAIVTGYNWRYSSTVPVSFKVTINGTDFTGNIMSYNGSSAVTVGSGSLKVPHNSDGSKSISFSFSVWDNISANFLPGSASGSGSMTLTPIARYANITSLTIASRTVNSITLSYKTDRAAWLFVRVNDGEWLNGGEPFASNVTSGSFTIYYKNRASTQRLDYNTSYKITVLCRADGRNGSLDTFKDITTSTYDIAKISNASNFNHGNNASLTTTNPSGATMTLVMKIGSTQILSKTASTGNNTISFTDSNLDTIYKLYGTGSTLTVTYTVSINVNSTTYSNSKTCIITLKGNQKTVRTKISNTWRRGDIWTKVSGTWRRAVIWTKINGTWRRGI